LGKFVNGAAGGITKRFVVPGPLARVGARERPPPSLLLGVLSAAAPSRRAGWPPNCP